MVDKKIEKSQHPNQRLKPIILHEAPKVLLLGNGLNRLCDLCSWEDLVSYLAKKSDIIDTNKFDLFKNLSLLIQIYALGTENENFNEIFKKCMCEIDNKIINLMTKTDESVNIYSDLCKLNFQAILTTNYDFLVEMFLQKEKESQKVEIKADYGRKNVTSNKLKQSLYAFKYITSGKKNNSKYLNEPYVWHIHGRKDNLKSIIFDLYSYGTNLSVLQSYGYHFIKKYMNCIKKEQNNVGKVIEFNPESWLDYFFLGDVYIVGLGLGQEEFELKWLLAYRNRIQSNIKKSVEKQYQSEVKLNFGKVYFMDTYPVNIEIRDEKYDKKLINQKQLELEILGCEYTNFCKNNDNNTYENGYREILKTLKNEIK